MNTKSYFDMIVVGGGPAGTRAAFEAVKKGMKTALVEAGFLGGTCVNTGCIPTKFLLGGSAAIPLLAAQRKYRVARGEADIDFAALQTRKDRFITGIRQSIEKQLEQAGVTIVRGTASFTGPASIMVKGAESRQNLDFGKCIIAVGSRPAFFPGIAPDGASVVSSSGLLALGAVPESLIVVGGGAIGIELGEIFHRFGAKITLVEALPRILPGEDPVVSEAVRAHFKREGWSIHTERRISGLSTVDGRAALRFEDGEELGAATALVAVGRRPCTAGLAPEAAGLTVNERGWLAVDENLLCAENIYAVGDANGKILLAHAGDNQARHAAAHASGRKQGPYAPPAMPACVYGTFEVMRVGPTVAELKSLGLTVSESRAELSTNAIAQSYGHPQGFVRMIWADDVLRAVSAVGHGVSHLVSAAALLLERKTKKNDSSAIIFAHPTLDEVLESAMLST